MCEIIKLVKTIFFNIDHGPSKLRFGTALLRMSKIGVTL